MFEVMRTAEFVTWLRALRDRRAQKLIAIRIQRVGAGLLGDVKSLGEGVSELRVNYGLGYRLYFTRRDGRVIWLLCGGDKGSQDRDIRRAKAIAADLEV